MKKMMLGIVALCAATAVGDMKIGTVNMVDLVKLHPSYETNKALLKSTDKDYKAKLDKRQDEIKAIADEGKKAQEDLSNPMLSATAKASAQKKLEGVAGLLEGQGMAIEPAVLKRKERSHHYPEK